MCVASFLMGTVTTLMLKRLIVNVNADVVVLLL